MSAEKREGSGTLEIQKWAHATREQQGGPFKYNGGTKQESACLGLDKWGTVSGKPSQRGMRMGRFLVGEGLLGWHGRIPGLSGDMCWHVIESTEVSSKGPRQKQQLLLLCP